MSNQPYNPWETVNNPPEQAVDIYGEAHIDAWPCMLVAGMGKVPYDEKIMTPEGVLYRRNTAVDVTIIPLAESKAQFETKRSMLAEFGEWKDTCWPSIKGLGILNAQEIEGKFCRVEMVPTGRKYTNQNGEEREAKAIKFTHIFADRAACLQADTQEHGHPNGNGNGNGSSHSATPPAQAAANGNGNGSSKERETALVFAKAFVINAMRQTGKDMARARDVLAPMLAAQPIISKHYTIDSPEIIQMMADEHAK